VSPTIAAVPTPLVRLLRRALWLQRDNTKYAQFPVMPADTLEVFSET
jgi:hypothetical protein